MLTCEIWCTYITNYILHCDITFSFYRGSCDLWGSVVPNTYAYPQWPVPLWLWEAGSGTRVKSKSEAVTGIGSESQVRNHESQARIDPPNLFESSGSVEARSGAMEGCVRSQWRRGDFKMEAWMLKMEPRRICGSVVPDLHHFDKDPDPWPDLDLNRS